MVSYGRDEFVNSILYGEDVPSIYAILDESARNWWYHKQLRKVGDVVEARKRERASILMHVRQIKECLANGGYATISQSGGNFTLTIGDGHNLSGHSPDTVMAAYLAGVPLLSFRNAKDTVAIYRLPLPVIGDSKHAVRGIEEDKERLGDKYPTLMSKVRLGTYFDLALKTGASLSMYPSARTKGDGHYAADPLV